MEMAEGAHGRDEPKNGTGQHRAEILSNLTWSPRQGSDCCHTHLTNCDAAGE
jgi:hypothetical protein